MRYIDSEETKAVPLRDHVLMLVGKNSKRMYEIQIDAHALGVEQIALGLQHAISELATTQSRGGLRENYETLQQVLSDEWSKLSPALANTGLRAEAVAV